MMIATRNQVVSGSVESPGHDARQPECVIASPGPLSSVGGSGRLTTLRNERRPADTLGNAIGFGRVGLHAALFL
jgi:hypothetical protein